MRTSEQALREVQQAIERGDLDAAEPLLDEVDRLNAAVRELMGIDQPYR